jgi:hypothetical protein
MKWVRVSCGESKFEFLVDWGVYIINVWLYISNKIRNSLISVLVYKIQLVGVKIRIWCFSLIYFFLHERDEISHEKLFLVYKRPT